VGCQYRHSGINGTAILNMPVTVNSVTLGIAGQGTLDVSGSNSLTTNTTIVGNSAPGSGTLNISGGGLVSDTTGYIGALSGSVGAVSVAGSGSRWNTSGVLYIGDYGQGTLTISSGGVVTSSSANLGFQSGSSSSVTVSGSGSRWNNSGTLVVGSGASGTLAVEDSARVSTGILWVGNNGNTGTLIIESGSVLDTGGTYIGGGGPGTVTVTGTGSQLNDSSGSNIIGYGNGQGTLNIQSGGVVNLNGADIGGYAGTAPGTVTVSGAGSQFNVPAGISLGLAGVGTLNIQNGGVANLGDTDIGGIDGSAPGILTVEGAGSHLNVNGGLNVALAGDGTLTIESSGMANITGSTLVGGTYANVPGIITVSGPGSQLHMNGATELGFLGNGTLNIENGGLVSTGSSAVLGARSGSLGTAMVVGQGSQWNIAGDLYVGDGGSGLLTVTNGGTVRTQTLTIGTLGEVDPKGGTLYYTTLYDNGTLDPVGLANLIGNLLLENAGGSVILNAMGLAPGQYGQLDITGSAAFHGMIVLDFIDGFAPKQGDVFDLINISGSSNFSGDTVEIEGLQPGFEYSVSFANGEFTLTALNNGIPATTPEPGTFVLLGSGLLILSYGLRRRMSK
jgi:T5SS/PEP-CTERM-associated repeat protein